MSRTREFSPLLATVLILAALTTVGEAQTYSVLYNFGTKSGDPNQPSYSGIIVQGRDGNLYSTAPGGGTLGDGAAFEVTPIGAVTVLYNFDVTHGAGPFSGLVLATNGNFYGTTSCCGSPGRGTVFKITPDGHLTVLHTFMGGSDGEFPNAPPVQGTDRNFYGTTSAGGGSPFCSGGCGTVYKITPSGTLTILHAFNSGGGSAPTAPLLQASDGKFYGTASYGGHSEGGVIFKITPSGKFTVLYKFDSIHGYEPYAPLVQGTDGNLYGTTRGGGPSRFGVVFKITTSGNLTVLHSFNGTDGSGPIGGLVQAADGNFYGSTQTGGNSSNCLGGCGTIFRITPQGVHSVLYNFDNTTGAFPGVTIFQHTNGLLYGDTSGGGTGNVKPCAPPTITCGVFYSLNVGLGPFVSLLPYSGKVGTTVEFLGQGFKGTTGVSFNGTPAPTFKVVSGTYLTAKVPSGATTGFVTVTTPKRKLRSNKKFRVR
jgi:uncharacterized repeat protein (TIGR03803 family)